MKHNPIDTATGKLKNYAQKELYLYLAKENKAIGGHGYFTASYGAMARHLGLPWQFAGSDNADTIVKLRAALTQIQRRGLICVKPGAHTTVRILLRVSPRKLQRRYGRDVVDNLFAWNPARPS